ncbi:MAG: flagellar secretion chaperone FliS [Acidobacteriaceae bacterium]|jgi:flagellar protein FliS|nr:flagellar secretion chaperone FliS [Acidobacteriaceae bacterium]
MRHYHQAAIESASSVQLIVALYDGLQRFLLQAAAACDDGDPARRRDAARRALNIITHLQASLRMDVGGEPAERLGDFYVAIFADVLRGSATSSGEIFRNTAREVWNVREAWQMAAQDRSLMTTVPRDLQTWEEQAGAPIAIRPPADTETPAPAWIA